MLSQVQWERIQASDISRQQTEARLDELTGDTATAKKTLTERQEALLKAMSGARDEHPDGDVPEEAIKSLFGLEADYSKSLTKFEVVDREKRRTADLAKKFTERVLKLIHEASEGPDLYTESAPAGKADKNAWGKVMLADVCEELVVKPFQENGIFSVEDYLAAWSEDRLIMATKQKSVLNYVHQRVADFLGSRKIDTELVNSFIEEAPKKEVTLSQLALADNVVAKAAEKKADDSGEEKGYVVDEDDISMKQVTLPKKKRGRPPGAKGKKPPKLKLAKAS